MQESSFLRWCLDLPVASSSAPFALSSMWTLSSSTPVSLIFLQCCIIVCTSLCKRVIDSCSASPQVSSASLQTTRDGLGPGGQASSCVVPYSFVQPSWCLASLSPCRTRRERRVQTASRLCFLPLWLQTMRLQSPAMGLHATMSLPTAPPAVSNSGVSALDPIILHCFSAMKTNFL